MSGGKFSPGPWHVGNESPEGWLDVIDSKGDRVDDHLHRTDPLGAATARLIAAAPEMYEALKRHGEGTLYSSEARALLARIDGEPGEEGAG